MQITYYSAQRIYQVILELKDKSFSFETNYKLAKLKEFFEKEFGVFEQEIHNIILRYVKRDKDGNIIVSEKSEPLIQEDKVGDCLEEIKRVQKVNLYLEDIYFSLEELKACDLTIEELQTFLPLIRKE